MARKDIINQDGSVKWDVIGGFNEQLDSHTGQLAEKATKVELSDLSSKLNGSITPEQFTGTDFQKVQAAFDTMYDTGQAVVLPKMYNITGNTIKLKKITELPRQQNTIIGLGGGIIKNDRGFIYDTLNGAFNIGELFIMNVRYESIQGAGTKVFNAANIIRVFSFFNYYKNVDNVMDATGRYCQSMRFQKESIVGGKGWAFTFPYGYDLTIDDCLVEWREHGIEQSGKQAGYNIRITKNTIEGLTGKTLTLNDNAGLIVKENYIELNQGGYFDFSGMTSKPVKVEDNTFHLSTEQINNNETCIKWGRVPGVTNISKNNNTNGGYLHDIPSPVTIVSSEGDTNETNQTKLVKGYLDNFNKKEDQDLNLQKILSSLQYPVLGDSINQDELYSLDDLTTWDDVTSGGEVLNNYLLGATATKLLPDTL